MGCLVSTFTVSINPKSFPWDVRCAQGTYFPHFRQRPMSDIEQNTYAAAAAWLPTCKKSRLNWKLKISNTADNASVSGSRKPGYATANTRR